MEFMNDFTKLQVYPKEVILMATQVLAAYAPHLAEEVWQRMGGQGSLAFVPFPKVDEKYLQDEVITYVVQINGKLRGRFELPKDQTQDVVLEAAKKHPNIIQFIDGQAIDKVVFVPNKLMNIVLKASV